MGQFADTAKAIAVIPARGGSKRIPRKNIRPLGGKPLLGWPVLTALESGLFSRVIVSTDDDEIRQVALAHGAEVPILRPADLSDDFTPTVAVVAHELRAALKLDTSIAAACCIYPAAFSLTADDLSRGFDLLRDGVRPYVSSVVQFAHPIQRAMELSADGGLRFANAEAASSRTQDLVPMWHDAGQFYWGVTLAWLDAMAILPNSAGLVMPSSRVVDIDTEDDWIRAEQLMRVLRQN